MKQKLKEHRISKPLAPPLPQPSIIEYNRGAHAPLCFDSKELPDFEAMKDRMTAIAMENGLLGGVHDDCIELMLHALEVNERSWHKPRQAIYKYIHHSFLLLSLEPYQKCHQ